MRLRHGWIWYLAGLLLAVVAGLIAVFALRQAVPAAQPAPPATRPIIVARQDLAARAIVAPDAIEPRDYPLTDIPSGAIYRLDDAAGKFLLAPAAAGQPLLAQNLVVVSSAGGGAITNTAKLAALLPENKIGVVLPANDLLSKSGEVDTGDHVDILASLIVVGAEEGQGGQVTLMTLQNVAVVKVLNKIIPATNNQPEQRGEIQGLVVAVDPQDAVTLKYFIDAGANVSIDVRPAKLTSIFDVVPVTINYLADKFGLKVPVPLP